MPELAEPAHGLHRLVLVGLAEWLLAAGREYPVRREWEAGARVVGVLAVRAPAGWVPPEVAARLRERD